MEKPNYERINENSVRFRLLDRLVELHKVTDTYLLVLVDRKAEHDEEILRRETISKCIDYYQSSHGENIRNYKTSTGTYYSVVRCPIAVHEITIEEMLEVIISEFSQSMMH